MRLCTLTAAVVLLLTALSAAAQSHAPAQTAVLGAGAAKLRSDSVLRQFEARFAAMDAMMANVRVERQPLLLYTDPYAAVADSLFDAQTAGELSAMRRKTGLEITGQVYQRLDSTLGLDDEDAYSRYTTKLQGELGWDFFGSSLLQRRTRTRQLQLQGELRKLQARRATTDEPWLRLGEDVRRLYAGAAAEIMRTRLANTRVLNAAYAYTLQQQRESSQRMLAAIQDEMDLERQLALLDGGGADTDASAGGNAPAGLRLPQATVVSVDTVALFATLGQSNPELRAIAVRGDLLEAERRLTNYAHTMRLTPFARVSQYLRSGIGNLGTPSTNVDLGVRFTLPLYSEAAAKRRALAAERQLTTLSGSQLNAETAARCRQQLAQIARLNAAVAAEAGHIKRIEAFVAMRREAYLHAPSGYDYTLRLEEYNEYLKSAEQLIRLMGQRNEALVSLQKASMRADLATLITETPL